jgi:DNA-binding CsgD family transcriptional regulator
VALTLAGRQVTDLLWGRARALGLSGKLVESRQVLHELLAALPSDSAERLRVVAFCAHVERALGRHAEVRALASRELAAMADHDSVPAAVLKLVPAVSQMQVLGSPAPIRDLVADILAVAAKHGSPVLGAGAHAVGAMLELDGDSVDRHGPAPAHRGRGGGRRDRRRDRRATGSRAVAGVERAAAGLVRRGAAALRAGHGRRQVHRTAPRAAEAAARPGELVAVAGLSGRRGGRRGGSRRGGGVAPDATADLRRAQTVFAACGAQLLLRETIAALDVPSVASTPSALATLTRRERQVAQLVGEGATNRQVARRLEMAEKTVEGHLSRIFGKLEVQSRAALAHLLATATVAR